MRSYTPLPEQSGHPMAVCTPAIQAHSLSRPRTNRRGPWGLGIHRVWALHDLSWWLRPEGGPITPGPGALAPEAPLHGLSGQHPPQKPLLFLFGLKSPLSLETNKEFNHHSPAGSREVTAPPGPPEFKQG